MSGEVSIECQSRANQVRWLQMPLLYTWSTLSTVQFIFLFKQAISVLLQWIDFFPLLSETGYQFLQFLGIKQGHWLFSFFKCQVETLWNNHIVNFTGYPTGSLFVYCDSIGVMANQILGFLGGGKGVGNPSDRLAPNPVDFLKVLSTGTVDTILKL